MTTPLHQPESVTLRDEIQDISVSAPRFELTLLDEIEIASPCPARWERMTGDDRSRHCGSCDRTVYNLAGLTNAQIVALIREKEGSLCVRLFRRRDGKILTADCPEGLRARLDRAWRRGNVFGPAITLWVLVTFLGGLFLWGAASFLGMTSQATMGVFDPSYLQNGPPGPGPGPQP